MKLSHNWLQQYIKFKFTPEQLSEKLTMLGLEVEGYEHLGAKFEGFVVGKVLEVEKHPNAYKLSVCRVDVGKEQLQVVCGAPNVAVEQKVAVGRSGAVVPKNQHDPNGKPFTLSNVKIRGVESFGMICSEYELDLGSDKDGILVLDAKARVGQKLASYLGLNDVVYEIGITPNRPDLLSHFGVAREIGLLVGKEPSRPKVRLKESNTPIKKHLSVNVEDRVNCSRFAVRLILGVKIQPSPAWLQSKLRSIGLRPRNNIVDITNYVMLECGQPLHAFDLANLKGNRIVVRQAGAEKTFVTLDGKEHSLPSEAVMVCDGEREVSIAGIMGGENSEISDSTTDVVLESAYWNPSSIRRTAKTLGIHSDAAYRFERGADPNANEYALERAAQLVLELAGGELLKGRIDIYPKRIQPETVPLRPARCNHVLGTSLSPTSIVALLKKLNIKRVRSSKETILFRVPTYRPDLVREIDLIEEVARVFGYNNIDSQTIAPIDFDQRFDTSLPADALRTAMAGFGYREAVTISIQDAEVAQLGCSRPVHLLNPLGKEMSTMRSSLVPGLLRAFELNQRYGNTDLRLFEIGHVFSVSESKQTVENMLEEERVCLLLTGNRAPRHWNSAQEPVDVFDLKGEVADLLNYCGLDSWRYIYYSTSETLADNPILVEIQGTEAGYLGKVKEEVRKKFGIEQEAFVAELKLSLLKSQRKKSYEPLAKFQVVYRDVAFVVDESVAADDVMRCLRESESTIVRDVELFDVYVGENLPSGKKSLALSIELLSREKTLTDAEIEMEIRTLVARVEREFSAELRSV